MKNIMIGMVVLGFLVVATAVRIWAESQTISTKIGSSVGNLRNEGNASETARVCNRSERMIEG
jgi:hypothetical protein